MTAKERPGGRAQISALRIAFVIIIFFVGLDVALRIVLFSWQVIDLPVDIQSPATLSLKLQRLETFDGVKVALLGDSLIYGHAMAEHGDTKWREHDLATLIQKRLQTKSPGMHSLALNLGMNGATVCDVKLALGLVLEALPDLVIMDLTLRSFSEDFNPEKERLTRPWLADMRSTYDWDTGFWTPRFAEHYWMLYRSRNFLQYLILGAPPEIFARQQRDALIKRLTKDKFASMERLDANFLLIMQAKKRFESVSLSEDSAQVQCLKDILALLDRKKQSALFFYATENPGVRPSILDQGRYDRLLQRLQEIVDTHAGEHVRFISPVYYAPASRYLDQVHVDAKGYEMLLETLWPYIEKSLLSNGACTQQQGP